MPLPNQPEQADQTSQLEQLTLLTQSFCKQHNLSQQVFYKAVIQVYWPLINKLQNQCIQRVNQQQLTTPFVIGLNGAQGSGKSTLTEYFKYILGNLFSLNVLSFSIDDLYLPRSQRILLAKEVHPLLITRGVPLTHDTKLALHLFDQLSKALPDQITEIPQFSKALDDRKEKQHWLSYKGKPDIILFEGWCVATRPQLSSALTTPINQLEQKDDADVIWRQAINDALHNQYAELFRKIEHLVVLQAPNFECVFQWRLQQEAQLIEQLDTQSDANSQQTNMTMNEQQLKVFIAHFERLTRHNLSDIPLFANDIVHLNETRFPIRWQQNSI